MAGLKSKVLLHASTNVHFTARLSLVLWEYHKDPETGSIKLLLESSHFEVSGSTVLEHTSVNIIPFIFLDYFYTKPPSSKLSNVLIFFN